MSRAGGRDPGAGRLSLSRARARPPRSPSPKRRLPSPAAVVALAALLVALPVPASAQQASIQGIVADSATGRPLENVAVTLEREGARAHGVFTDRNGFYQIPGIEPGTYVLIGQLLGFRESRDTLTLQAGEQRTVSLRVSEAPLELEGIVVSMPQGATVRDLGRQVVTPENLRMVPLPGGSGDLATYLQTLPGVTTTGDRGGQLFVRGGTAAENLVLVDGIPIYQPFHILGFYSVFPEDLVSRADFFPGGFGARYQGRTSSVLDVRIRDGIPGGFRASASAGPFIAEALAEGGLEGATWLASVRRSLVEETSEPLLGTRHPLSFGSQLFKVTSTHLKDDRCSLLALHTSDRGRLDPEEKASQVSWENLLFGLRCVTLRPSGQLLEVQWSYSGSNSAAVSRGSSQLRSEAQRWQHDLHATGLLRSVPVEGGYELSVESLTHDLTELFAGTSHGHDGVFSGSAYVEPALSLPGRVEVRPGLVMVLAPRFGLEPRLRASWEPFERSSGLLQGTLGLYRQNVVGTSDMRDVGSVFVAWMDAPDDVLQEALQASLSWQQDLGESLRWSLDAYVKELRGIPVPIWRAVAEFVTDLGRADGRVRGTDLRVEYTTPRFYGFLGYGYSWTLYEASQSEFSSWFGDPVQSYHPPHDRRHQVNAVGTLELGRFRASARWQLGSGLPYTRPMGFDEAFDFSRNLHDVHSTLGVTRLVLDRPLTGRLPVIHRLDLSLERTFQLPRGEILAQVGVINAYDRSNMFYYDLFTGRRLDQLPFMPYASLKLQNR